MKKELIKVELHCDLCDKVLLSKEEDYTSFGQDIDICFECLKKLPAFFECSDRKTVSEILQAIKEDFETIDEISAIQKESQVLFKSCDYGSSFEIDIFKTTKEMVQSAESYFEDYSGDISGEWEGYRIFYGYENRLYRVMPKIKVKIELIETDKGNSNNKK